jgi:hypothetical protein
MAEPDPSYRPGIQHRRHSITHRGKHAARARVEQQRFGVAHQELIELQIEIRHEGRNPE